MLTQLRDDKALLSDQEIDENKIIKTLVITHQSSLNYTRAAFDSNTLRKIEAAQPEELQSALTNLLNLLQDSLNSKTGLSDIMAVEIVMAIISDHGDLTLDEIILALYKGKKGHYGSDFNRLDISIICSWIIAFRNDPDRKLALVTKQRELDEQKWKTKSENNKPKTEAERQELQRQYNEQLSKMARKGKEIKPISITKSLSEAEALRKFRSEAFKTPLAELHKMKQVFVDEMISMTPSEAKMYNDRIRIIDEIISADDPEN